MSGIPQAPRCAWIGCDNPLPPPARRGRARIYCSDSCRMAAARHRRISAPYRPDIAWSPDVDPAELTLPPEADYDTQVARAVLEAAMISSAFARLAAYARPELAAPSERMCRVIRKALDKEFPGWNR